MRISVVGTGYVGLVTGVGFAHHGHDVVLMDINREKIASLEAGELPIYEPGLGDLLVQNRHRLTFTTEAGHLAAADVIFLCVGTPASDTGHADMRAFWAAAETVHDTLPRSSAATVAIKSTVPIGTNAALHERMTDHPHLTIASCPEFLKEGDAVRDFMKPDRVVIGTSSGPGALLELFRPLVRGHDRILVVAPESAEMIKYASNTMLAVRISFMNELAQLAELVGADIDDVRRGMGADSRIGPAFLYAGLGFGGSCFPKDVRALVSTSTSHRSVLALAEDALSINEDHRLWFAQKVDDAMANERGDRIALWGLSFKPETDDIRESPGIWLADELAGSGYAVTVHDPVAMPAAEMVLGDRVTYAPNAYAAAEGADALVLATEWPQYRRPDIGHLLEVMSGKLFADGRNAWSPDEIRSRGGQYLGVGRR